MTFPNITPTGRSFSAGDFPIKTFRTNNGKDTRILYGDRRTDRSIDLTYENITDALAYEFFDDYDQKTGTFREIPAGELAPVFNGWAHTTRLQISGGNAIQWRYAEPPQIRSVGVGRSTVTVRLTGVV
jgi:hypothetical protein